MPTPDLERERVAVEAAIRTAFKGVDRAGGVSWSESRVIDNSGTPEQKATARAADTEQYWEALVDDPSWNDEPGVGGFNFLDPVSFRYYMAPAMVRCVRRGHGDFISYALTIRSDFKRGLISKFTNAQLRTTARFIDFMHRAEPPNMYGGEWDDAYKSYWQALDHDSTM